MTRFIVPPLVNRKGMLSDLHGCTGFTMEDGTRYGTSRSGVIDVERLDHARAIRRDPNIAGDIVAESFHAHDPRPGRLCPCGPTEFWPWTKVCPRCGEPLAEPNQEEDQ